jgi:hypothetical protein
LTTEYKNNRQKLEYVCPSGHRGSIKWSHFKDGHRCGMCAGNKKLSIEFVRLNFYNAGYELISDTYVNSSSKLKYRCPNGHEHSMSWNNWYMGCRCPDCSLELVKSKLKLDYAFIKESFEKEGYKLLSDSYENAFKKLYFVCPNGHASSIIWNSWQRGSRCEKCFESRSEAEIDLSNFIKGLGFEILENNRTLIAPYELDIVIPSKKIAIEYCGLYWHSELAGKDRRYHLNKLKECEKKGYRLITVFEDEYVFMKKMVRSKLKMLLGCSDDIVVYGRNCTVKPVSYKEACEFCNNNHLQKYASASVKLGAFYEDDLIAVATFSKPSISKGHYNNKHEGVWELSRFCSMIGYRVIGIFSKLLKYFEKNYEWSCIFSYADRRWSMGNVYYKTGFSLKNTVQPNYWYFTGQKRIHRFKLRKSVCSLGCADKTEWELRKHQGYNRVWDCGNLKFEKFNLFNL